MPEIEISHFKNQHKHVKLNISNDSVIGKYLIAILCIAIASGIVTNERSYILFGAIIAFSFRGKLDKFSSWRTLVVLLTLCLVAFGTVKGFFQGHDVQHIARFALPLSTFAAFCLIPGLGILLFRARYFIAIVTFMLTFMFFYIVKTGDFALADSIMSGWTLTYSTNAGVSVWHYFAMPFSLCIIFEMMFNCRRVVTFTFGLISLVTLIMLWYLTDTSAFVISIIAVCIPAILSHRISNYFGRPVSIIMILFLFDFLTVKILSNWLLNQLQILGADDFGDLLRIIQLEYFASRVEFFGSGFGAVHDFPFELNQSRQMSQLIYPYASELPIINIIFNGGILAALWFSALIVVSLNVARSNPGGCQERKSLRRFAICCVGIIIGSMSNPYLFAPASMLLLAVLFDIFDLEFRRDLANQMPGALGIAGAAQLRTIGQ